MKSEIVAAGKYIPEKRVLNSDLQEWMDTSDEWIRTRTGIHQRHIAVNENTSDLCVRAAEDILAKTTINPEDIGFIIVATMTPDYQSPSVASLVQKGIKAKNSFAFDVSAACSGFVYALSVAEKLLASSDYPYGLVIGGETMSKAVDWSDRSTAVLFGDGAGGVLLGKTEESKGILSEKLRSDGERAFSLTSGSSPTQNPFTSPLSSNEKQACLQMDGRAIFDFAVRNVVENIRETIEKGNLQLEDIDMFLLHQANERLIKIIAKKLDVSLDKFAVNISEYGNTSAASIPILLDDMLEKDDLSLESGQTILLTGFGGGLTWGSIIYKL